MARRKNPYLGYSDRDPDPPKPRKKKKPKPRAKIIAEAKARKRREAIHKRDQYKERAKRMRPFFKDMFTASQGFDLRSPDKWTPAQKAKVTNYFRVIAPRITGDFVVKRYRRPENMAAAIDASLQEKPLKGQTAVAFSIDPGEKIEIKVDRGKASVRKAGSSRIKLKFDKAAFLRDPKAEVDRLLKQTNAHVFRILVGGQEQNKALTRADVMDEIVKLVENYAPKRIRKDQMQKPFTQWLNGLVAYEGTKAKTLDSVSKFIEKHKVVMAKKRKDHLDELSAKARGISVKTLRAKRTKRAKAKGRL